MMPVAFNAFNNCEGQRSFGLPLLHPGGYVVNHIGRHIRGLFILLGSALSFSLFEQMVYFRIGFELDTCAA
jgi:hypothetical protein